jgi:hypothetical protein
VSRERPPPHLSPDRQSWWDGEKWISPIHSPDGRYLWNGQDWQPVQSGSPSTGSWPIWAGAAIAAVAILAVVIIGISIASGASVGVPIVEPSPTSCIVGVSDHNARATVTASRPEPLCDVIAKYLRQQGIQPAFDEVPGDIVCEDTFRGYHWLVTDTGGHLYGSDLCAALQRWRASQG